MSPETARSALVTGAASGIGRALARELARRGFAVTVADIDGKGAARTASEIGGSARSARLDVRDAAAFAALVAEIEARHGRLDMLVNNAGIPISGEIQDLSVGHWDRIIDVNLRGVVHGVAAAYPGMQRRRGGTIVNMGSIVGLTVGPLGAPYAATKYAVVGLSLSLRAEAEAYGVKVSVLCPGAVDTPILDRDNPADLPAVPWRPDNRSYIARLVGKAMDVDRFAKSALDAVARGEGVVVRPFYPRIAWWTHRYLPWLSRWRVRQELAAERALAAKAGDPPAMREGEALHPPAGQITMSFDRIDRNSS